MAGAPLSLRTMMWPKYLKVSTYQAEDACRRHFLCKLRPLLLVHNLPALLRLLVPHGADDLGLQPAEQALATMTLTLLLTPKAF